MKVAAAGFSKPIVTIIAVLSLVLVSLVAAITVHLTGSESASAEGAADSTDISIARNAYSEVLDSINAEQLPLLRAKPPPTYSPTRLPTPPATNNPNSLLNTKQTKKYPPSASTPPPTTANSSHPKTNSTAVPPTQVADATRSTPTPTATASTKKPA